ncbi:MAG: polyprenyl synthetase family protein [Cyanobacteria bacterium P01_G01_bin.49]
MKLPSRSLNFLRNSTLKLDNYPADWPETGDINLTIHDSPHASSTIEWWYVNSHLTTEDGGCFSIFASFFKLVVGEDEPTPNPLYAYAVIWGMIDVNNQAYHTTSLIDRCTPQVGLKTIESSESDTSQTDPLLQRAWREVFEKGNVPLPDRLLKNEVLVNPQRLELDFDGNQFVKLDDGCYKLKLIQDDGKVGCECLFKPEKPAIRHGDNGVVQGNSGEDMFYYLISRCGVEGTLTVDNQCLKIKEGRGWYDHEFGSPNQQAAFSGIKQDIAWNWVSVQLENGYEVSAYDLFDSNQDGQCCGHWVIVIDPEGNWQSYSEFTFEPLKTWTSSRTFTVYPIQWQLEIPAANLSLFVQAEFPAQEFITLISKPSFWEGRVTVSGVLNSQGITGLGFVERSNFKPVMSLKEFLAAVGQETRYSIQNLLPLAPTDQQIQQLVAREDCDYDLQGLDFEQYSRALIQPIREIMDRGGKAWRSYALLACVDIVGGNSQPFLPWLALPELLHVGSLIVDDVEDRSQIRRGGLSCHHLYGEAQAINAGNACYFLGENLVRNSQLSEAQKLKIYEIYFETLRSAHAGQAIDIDGFSQLVPKIVKQGNGELLENRILTVHRLKSAVPARSLAQIGAILGKGTNAQVLALGNYFEALGLAFQIIDDVLNLRGYEKDLKVRGEDIAVGKVTLPVAKAMSRLVLAERQKLWEAILSKPTQPSAIAAVIEQLERCGAVQACHQQATELVESAWEQLDPLVPDSDVKTKLRAFSWYVLERHY